MRSYVSSLLYKALCHIWHSIKVYQKHFVSGPKHCGWKIGEIATRQDHTARKKYALVWIALTQLPKIMIMLEMFQISIGISSTPTIDTVLLYI